MAQPGPDSELDHDADGSDDDHHDGEVIDPSTDESESEGEGEWQFGLDEVGPDGVVEPEPEPIEPGTPRLENVVFVLLGVAGTLLLLSTVI
jgi:hypothetical protein